MKRPRNSAMTPLRSGLGELRSSGGVARWATCRSIPAPARETPSSESRCWIACVLLGGAGLAADLGQLLDEARAGLLVLLARDDRAGAR